jgi:hypothetical protein
MQGNAGGKRAMRLNFFANRKAPVPTISIRRFSVPLEFALEIWNHESPFANSANQRVQTDMVRFF